MTNAELQVRFDTVADDFDPGDEISVENANYEMHKNWRNFLEAGFDVASVVRMMSPADIWEHYDDLIVYGAKIDMTKLFNAFRGGFFDEDFTKEHWDELVNRGVSPDLLADRCYGDCDISSTTDLEDLLGKNVSMSKAFELVRSWLEIREEWPEEQVEILTWLYDHGLSKNDVKEWLAKNAHSYMEDYIIESGSDFYEKFGMEDNNMIDHWLERYGYRFFSEEELSDLPDAISVDKLISFFSMREIIENCRPYAFDDFIADYLKAGKDINDLAQKFMNEIGYSSDSSDSGALLDLVYAGVSVDIIDPAKYLDLVDASQLDDCEAGSWYDYFESNGYDSQRISRFLREEK
ncbi:MAG: hypothetical protein Q4A36_00875 [Candidatus Saccharibacteria bacterium]|nr:hypothetical protein [Candidatus Saccharibacteria bacterium]